MVVVEADAVVVSAGFVDEASEAGVVLTDLPVVVVAEAPVVVTFKFAVVVASVDAESGFAVVFASCLVL